MAYSKVSTSFLPHLHVLVDVYKQTKKKHLREKWSLIVHENWRFVCLHFICLSFTNSFMTSFDKEQFSQQKFLVFAGEVITLSPLFFPTTTSFPLKVQGSAFSPCICVRSYTRKCWYLFTKFVRILTLLIIYLQTFSLSYCHTHKHRCQNSLPRVTYA